MAEKEQRIGVYVCWCGSNIAKMVDVERVSEDIGKLPNVVIAKNYKYMCSDPGQDLVVKDIKEHNLNRVVVAAPGNGFGEPGEGYVRLALTVSKERLEEALARLAKL